MKPTQLAELFANIKASFVSFFSILMFVALGVGVFAGIYWMAPALQSTADKVYAEDSFHNFQIQYPYGLTDDDLAQLEALEGVDAVEPARQSFQIASGGNGEMVVKVQSMPETIDVLELVEGTLPTGTGQIVMDPNLASSLGLSLGDTVTFDVDGQNDEEEEAADDEDGMRYLTGRSFTLVGLVNSSEYLCDHSDAFGFAPVGQGSVDGAAWVTMDDFDREAFYDAWPLVNVRCSSLEGLNTFGEAYKADSEAIETRITELGDVLSNQRYTSLYNDAKAKIDEAEAKLEDARNKITDGERQLGEARQQIADGEQRIADGEAQLASESARLAEGEQALADRRGEFQAQRTAAQAQLDEVHAQLSAAQAEYDAAVAAIAGMEVPDDVKAELAQKKAELDAAWQQYNDQRAQYEAEVARAESELADAEAQLAAARAQKAEAERALADARAQLDDARQQLADKEAELEDAKVQLAEGTAELEDAKEQLEQLENFDWTVVPRAYNNNAVRVSIFSDILNNLSYSMAVLFIIVGLLVSYSAVSRIVHEQIIQIGTKKALGLHSREITLSFLLYATFAVVLGAILGLLIGTFVVEGIIGDALAKQFIFDRIAPYFDIKLALGITAIQLVLILGATWLACRRILREHAVELLKGERPPGGKVRFFEKWKVWDKLPLYTQTIINNCINDKRRVFSTIVGVAGCTALVVTAITLNDDVMKSYDIHYRDIYDFNAIVYVDTDEEGSAEAIADTLEGEGLVAVPVLRQSKALQLPDGGRSVIKMLVPEDEEAFSQVYRIHPTAKAEVDLSGEGVWVVHAYERHMGAKVGDDIAVSGSDEVSYEMPIAGFYEFYLTHEEIVVGKDTYERVFDTEAVPNAVLVNTGALSIEEVEALVAGTDGFTRIVDDWNMQGNSFRSFSNISRTVVLVYLVLSVLMAIVVLLNLNVMFIEEKKRELIVLMINGFSVKDAKRYVYNDTIVLTILGIILGLILGSIMGFITVGAIEPSTAALFRGIDGRALLVGTGVSAVLSFVMSVIALRRIPAFKLTDINKA